MAPSSPDLKAFNSAKPSSKSADNSMKNLVELTDRYETLLSRFLETLTSTSTDTKASSSITDPPNPLHVFRDSAQLVKAHTTKLSLLVLNKPFTPSAISGELKSAVEVCLLGMMGALEIMEGDASKETAPAKQLGSRWGATMVKESRARIAKVVREMRVMVQEVRNVLDDENYSQQDASSSNKSTSRDTLSSTGVVWEACDHLIELERLGVAGLAVQKAEQYRETLLDALTELKGWVEEADEEDDEGYNTDGFEDDFKDYFGESSKIPKGDTALRSQVDDSLRKLKTISFLFQAVSKRRFKTFPSALPDLVATRRLEDTLSYLRTIPETVDELAASFYALDGNEAQSHLEACIAAAMHSNEIMKLDWFGNEDEFTQWCMKWRDAMKN
jgi:hypothetical protein